MKLSRLLGTTIFSTLLISAPAFALSMGNVGFGGGAGFGTENIIGSIIGMVLVVAVIGNFMREQKAGQETGKGTMIAGGFVGVFVMMFMLSAFIPIPPDIMGMVLAVMVIGSIASTLGGIMQTGHEIAMTGGEAAAEIGVEWAIRELFEDDDSRDARRLREELTEIREELQEVRKLRQEVVERGNVKMTETLKDTEEKLSETLESDEIAMKIEKLYTERAAEGRATPSDHHHAKMAITDLIRNHIELDKQVEAEYNETLAELNAEYAGLESLQASASGAAEKTKHAKEKKEIKKYIQLIEHLLHMSEMEEKDFEHYDIKYIRDIHKATLHQAKEKKEKLEKEEQITEKARKEQESLEGYA